MIRAYLLDLRERGVAAGESCRAVAATFRVSVAGVVRWSHRFRATLGAQRRTRSPAGGPMRCRVNASGCCSAGRKPDLTLRAIGAERAERRVKMSHFAVWHFFVHEGITFKKACTQRLWSGVHQRDLGQARLGPTTASTPDMLLNKAAALW
jgi:transposase